MKSRTHCLSLLLVLAALPKIAHCQKNDANAILRDAYAISKTADSEAEYTLIVDKLIVLSDDQLSDETIAYKRSLLAWALNRRGEKRWDRMQTPDDEDGKAAASDFTQSYKLDPDRWRTKQNIAFLRAAEGDLAGAEKLLDEVLQQQPSRANTYFNRGELRYEQGKLPEAIEDYSRAITLSPREADFHTSRAHARYRFGQTDLAIKDYRSATELDAQNGSKQVDLADALQSGARWLESIRAYRAAIGLNAQNVRAQLNLAWLLATAPDPRARNGQEALKIINGLQTVPEEEQFRFIDTHAAALAEVKNFEAAARVATTGQNIVPEAERKSFMARLAMYKSGRTYRQPIPSP